MELIKGEKVDTHDGYHWIKVNCPICDLRPTDFVGKRGGTAHRANLGVETEIWACGKCGLMFADPMPIPIGGIEQHYSVDADDYFENHESETRLSWGRVLVEEAEEFLGGRKGKMLDVGAGRGEIILCAKEKGWEVAGVEPSESFADYAEKATGIKIHRRPVEKCDFADEEFDVVILSAVLEHLYNPDEVVAEISRITKRGGLFYLDVPNERGLFFKVGNLYQKIRGTGWSVNLSPTFTPYHIFGFSPKSVKMLLAKHNYGIRKMGVYGGTSLVPEDGGGIRAKIEARAAKAITALSNYGNLGTYIIGWAVKK
jgi:SAM-dependent methyltransferase